MTRRAAKWGASLLHRWTDDYRRRQNLDLQRNSRVGATFSKALNRQSTIRMSVSRGACTTIGANFTTIAVGYNYAWAR